MDISRLGEVLDVMIIYGLPYRMKDVQTRVGQQMLRLTTLDKILYPDQAYTKAHIIEYYHTMAPIISHYVNDRPLTTIRYPNGITEDHFYSKTKPKWTPEWVSSAVIRNEDKEIDYIVIDQMATIVWLANLACLELHTSQYRIQDNYCPDHFIIDLDPDENLGFEVLREATMELKQFLEHLGYIPYVKTSGGKGFHVMVPIIPILPYQEASRKIKSVAQDFLKTRPSLYTLNVTKNKRQGKILIDIYRNHLSNTTIAPYSLRGKPGAPIAMPIPWSMVEIIKDAQTFNLGNYRDHMDLYGDVWSTWRSHETYLQKPTQIHVSTSPNEGISELETTPMAARSDISPSIEESLDHSKPPSFTLRLYDEGRLCYNLILETQDLLLSWLLPLGLPHAKGSDNEVTRLEDDAIVVREDQTWIIDSGSLQWMSNTATHLHFSLKGNLLNATYSIHKGRDESQWYIRAIASSHEVAPSYKYQPMLAIQERSVPRGNEYIYEVKWDGIRAILHKTGGKVKIFSRNGNDISTSFPELLTPALFRLDSCVIDGEIVVLDQEGKPQFHKVISRLQKSGVVNERSSFGAAQVVFYAFDVLSMGDLPVVQAPLRNRKNWLNLIAGASHIVRISTSFEDGEMLYNAIKEKNMEGIIAKRNVSTYQQGQRSKDWVKVKCRYQEEAFIIGYTDTTGERSNTFGALHLAQKDPDGNLRYKGKVGTGFDQKGLKKVFELLKNHPPSPKMIVDKVNEEHNTTWIQPQLRCLIEYASMTSNDTYREPVFIKMIASKQ